MSRGPLGAGLGDRAPRRARRAPSSDELGGQVGLDQRRLVRLAVGELVAAGVAEGRSASRRRLRSRRSTASSSPVARPWPPSAARRARAAARRRGRARRPSWRSSRRSDLLGDRHSLLSVRRRRRSSQARPPPRMGHVIARGRHARRAAARPRLPPPRSPPGHGAAARAAAAPCTRSGCASRSTSSGSTRPAAPCASTAAVPPWRCAAAGRARASSSSRRAARPPTSPPRPASRRRSAPRARSRARADGRAARARRSRARTAARRSSRSASRARRPQPGHQRQVVGAGEEPRREAAPLDAERARAPPGGGPCRRTRRASCSGTARLAAARPARRRRCGRRPCAWRIACCAVGGDGRPCCAGSGTAAASPIAQTFGVALRPAEAVGVDAAALVERQPELRDDRVRLDAGRPRRRVRVGTTSPVGERRPRRRGDLARASCCVRISIPRRAQLARRRTPRGRAGSPA